mmetsp:Transcript_16820/g.25596  ORF Transcript_16820/g.25596 Transcript_16820/m.25596 type:complete len:250 (+) Transcript_16820:71-820(+)
MITNMKRPNSDPVTLNNIAVQQLENNDFSSASELLKVALRMILPKQDNEPANDLNVPPSQLVDFRWSKNANMCSSGKIRDKTSQNRYIFARGVFIVRWAQKNRKMMRTGNTPLSSDVKASIIYNAALASHLQASQENNYISLQIRAQSLYRLSQNILREARNKGNRSKLCLQNFFHVAILNNLGQLSYELVDYELSTKYFNQLKRNLHFLKSKRKGSILLWQETGYCQNDLAGMFSNTAIMVPNTAPCA